MQETDRLPHDSRVLARCRVRSIDLGLPAPPVPVRLAFQVRDNTLVVVVQARVDAEGSAREWVDALEPRQVIERGGDDLVHLWAIFEPVPDRWADIVNLFELRAVRVDPDGRAEIALIGSRRDIHRTIEGARFSGVEVLGVEALGPAGHHLLTERQEEAARAAVQAGYYEVPRGVTLTDLAHREGVSPSSLSELLRRAEGRVMAKHLGESIKEAGEERLEPLPPSERGRHPPRTTGPVQAPLEAPAEEARLEETPDEEESAEEAPVGGGSRTERPDGSAAPA